MHHPDGKQAPIPFDLGYHEFAIDPAHAYSVRAEVRDPERPLFTAAKPRVVIAQARPMEAEIPLDPAE